MAMISVVVRVWRECEKCLVSNYDHDRRTAALEAGVSRVDMLLRGFEAPAIAPPFFTEAYLGLSDPNSKNNEQTYSCPND